jgi:hypothetical protein
MTKFDEYFTLIMAFYQVFQEFLVPLGLETHS